MAPLAPNPYAHNFRLTFHTMPSATKPITSDRALARALRISHTAISGWRQKFGALAPRGHDVEEWRGFMLENGLGVAGNRVSKDREHWLTRAAEFRAKLLELEEQRVRGEIITRAEVNRLHLHVATSARSLLLQALETELPVRCDGLSAAAMRPIMRETVDRVIERLAPLVEEFAAPPPAKE